MDRRCSKHTLQALTESTCLSVCQCMKNIPLIIYVLFQPHTHCCCQVRYDPTATGSHPAFRVNCKQEYQMLGIGIICSCRKFLSRFPSCYEELLLLTAHDFTPPTSPNLLCIHGGHLFRDGERARLRVSFFSRYPPECDHRLDCDSKISISQV